jgi:hypothetical protein
MEGHNRMAIGTILRADSEEMVTLDMPGYTDLVGGPREFDVELTRRSGEKIVLAATVQHCFTLTITDTNDNLNGAGWDVAEDPIFHMENIVRLRTPDGQTGYGHAERSARVSRLPKGIKRG